MEFRNLFALVVLLFSWRTEAQCVPDTLLLGSQDAVSSGLSTTPFQTSVGRGGRVQYLIPCSTLEALGGCTTAPITGVSMTVLDADPPGTLTTIHVRTKNTVATCQTAFDEVGFLVNLDSWTVQIDTGLFVIPFLSGPFNWAGCPFNVLLDISILRNELPGISPRVAIDTAITCGAHYGYEDGSGNLPGWQINETDPNATIGDETYLPVLGLFIEIPFGIEQMDGGSQTHSIFPNPASDHISIARGSLLPGKSNVFITDATGRVVMNKVITVDPSMTDITILIDGIASGLYQVFQNTSDGKSKSLGTIAIE